MFLRDGINFVARRCNFSTSSLSRRNLGDQITFPYSRCGRTMVVNSFGKVNSSRQVNVEHTNETKHPGCFIHMLLRHAGLFVCWSLTSLCHSNGHIETMPAREINPFTIFTALTRIRSQFLRTQ